MFDEALQNERDIGLDFWAKECPTVDSINFVVPAPDGSGKKAIDWNGMLDRPAQSVDQRDKISGLDAGVRAPRRQRSRSGTPASLTWKAMPRPPI